MLVLLDMTALVLYLSNMTKILTNKQSFFNYSIITLILILDLLTFFYFSFSMTAFKPFLFQEITKGNRGYRQKFALERLFFRM